MDTITNDQLLTFFQLIIALSVIRVWTMNFSKPSRWRGGGAKNMKEELVNIIRILTKQPRAIKAKLAPPSTTVFEDKLPND